MNSADAQAVSLGGSRELSTQQQSNSLSVFSAFSVFSDLSVLSALLIPQRLHWIHPRRFARGIQSKQHAGKNRGDDRGND
jgi:hypothetical protein